MGECLPFPTGVRQAVLRPAHPRGGGGGVAVVGGCLGRSRRASMTLVRKLVRWSSTRRTADSTVVLPVPCRVRLLRLRGSHFRQLMPQYVALVPLSAVCGSHVLERATAVTARCTHRTEYADVSLWDLVTFCTSIRYAPSCCSTITQFIPCPLSVSCARTDCHTLPSYGQLYLQ